VYNKKAGGKSIKKFEEALKDGFVHITEITDKETLDKLRAENIRIDEEGYYSFSFGDHKEFELCVEPIGDDGNYAIALYKNRVLLTQKLNVWKKMK
jgi:hypothetical protein